MKNNNERCETCEGWHRWDAVRGECSCVHPLYGGRLRYYHEHCQYWGPKEEDEEGEEENEE